MVVPTARILAVPRVTRRRRDAVVPYLYLLPSFVFLGAFTYPPLGIAATPSAMRWNVLTPEPTFVGLQNYRALVADSLFWLVLKNSAKFGFGVAFMPARKFHGAEVGGGNLAIGRKIAKKRQDAAWRFVEWVTSAENAPKWSIASGYVATRISSYDLPEMKAHAEKNPRYLVTREQLKYASAKMMEPNYQRIREILKKQLDDAVDGKVSPKCPSGRA